MKTSLAPTSSLVAEPLASNASSATAFSHQRSSSSTRRDEASRGQHGKHSRHASVVSASGTDQGLGQFSGTSPELAEGGYGFCTNCRRASARCSICRLPVRGIHFFCPICSHGGHHECYRNYYLKRPLMSPTRDDAASFGVPGSDGWGLSALSKHREATRTETDDTDSLRSERRDSNPPDPEKVMGPPKEREREGSIVSGLTTSVASLASLGLGSSVGSRLERGSVKEKERDAMSTRERERPREREAAKKRLMGHPCAAGCGHFCWMTNDPIEHV
ncbi:hypothetical protein M407DRAFT_131376 [Tulasnella calospora MUT 4182]|uniref:WDR59/RTC1-like RING zinc finger domain-containing protein n=1 Tax=Tulasnella calospora MUT 4182 TaxID=1051891 RepID=A0A0C3QRW1_9AGAM|nr:hypothetical protein M407DRAFT_131376 [Tulasnella calospora MUT 4182]